MKQTPLKPLVAVLLVAFGNAVQANGTTPTQSIGAEKRVTDVPAKKATNRNVGRATAKPFVSGERSRNAFDVPLLRDAKSLPSLTAPQVDTQRWNWSASKVPAAYVLPM